MSSNPESQDEPTAGLREAIWKTFEDNLDARIDEGQAYIHGIGDNVDEVMALFEQHMERIKSKAVIEGKIDETVLWAESEGGKTWRKKEICEPYSERIAELEKQRELL